MTGRLGALAGLPARPLATTVTAAATVTAATAIPVTGLGLLGVLV